MTDAEIEFAKAMKRWRGEKGYGERGQQRAFGKLLGYAGSGISTYETGKQAPSKDLLIALEWDLGIPFSEIDSVARPLLRERVREAWDRDRERLRRVGFRDVLRTLPPESRSMIVRFLELEDALVDLQGLGPRGEQ